MKLSKEEKEAFSKFLDTIAEEQSNAACNDFYVKNTPGNRLMLSEAIKYTIENKEDREFYLEELNTKSKKLTTFDSTVFDYIRNKVEKILEIKG